MLNKDSIIIVIIIIIIISQYWCWHFRYVDMFFLFLKLFQNIKISKIRNNLVGVIYLFFWRSK